MKQGMADIKYLKGLAHALDDAHRLDARICLNKNRTEEDLYVQISEELATQMAEQFRAIAERIEQVLDSEHGRQREKRFLLFSGPRYYPGGGMYDYRDAFKDLQSAVGCAEGHITDGDDWANIGLWTDDGPVPILDLCEVWRSVSVPHKHGTLRQWSWSE